MNRDILSLDFYGGEIIAALAAQDEETDTLRIRCLFRRPSRSFSGAFVRDMLGAREELSKVFEEVSGYVSFSPSVVVGLRGNFLSFKQSGLKEEESADVSVVTVGLENTACHFGDVSIIFNST